MNTLAYHDDSLLNSDDVSLLVSATNSNDYYVLRDVARNEHTPKSVLKDMIKEKADLLWSALKANPIFDIELAEMLVKQLQINDPESKLRLTYILETAPLTEETLINFFETGDNVYWSGLVQNVKTPAYILNDIAKQCVNDETFKEGLHVLIYSQNHPNIAFETLDFCAKKCVGTAKSNAIYKIIEHNFYEDWPQEWVINLYEDGHGEYNNFSTRLKEYDKMAGSSNA